MCSSEAARSSIRARSSARARWLLRAGAGTHIRRLRLGQDHSSLAGIRQAMDSLGDAPGGRTQQGPPGKLPDGLIEAEPSAEGATEHVARMVPPEWIEHSTSPL